MAVKVNGYDEVVKHSSGDKITIDTCAKMMDTGLDASTVDTTEKNQQTINSDSLPIALSNNIDPINKDFYEGIDCEDLITNDKCNYTCMECNNGQPWCIKHVLSCIYTSETDINEQDESGNTRLHYITHISERYTSILKLLLYMVGIRRDLNVNIQNNFGDTPLHLVLKKMRKPINKDEVLVLMSMGADIHMTNYRGQSPLDIARELSPLASQEIIDILKGRVYVLKESIMKAKELVHSLEGHIQISEIIYKR
ncbi:MAG: hypothetical protein QS721_00115 [Candidatus Endonucleobacter sp. (ex Gigantidas childressi)]|nr:hypothetical protein [Candidatus Endonucleobacter sp. (ex Gigantidas childressi)]